MFHLLGPVECTGRGTSIILAGPDAGPRIGATQFHLEGSQVLALPDLDVRLRALAAGAK